MAQYYERSGSNLLHAAGITSPTVPDFRVWREGDRLSTPLTPQSRVLLEKLTGSQLVKKLPAFRGTRRFITALTRGRHLFLSWTRSIQFLKSYFSISSHLRLGLPSGLFPSGFPTNTLYTPLLLLYTLHAPPISFFSILSPEQYWMYVRLHIINPLIM